MVSKPDLGLSYIQYFLKHSNVKVHCVVIFLQISIACGPIKNNWKEFYELGFNIIQYKERLHSKFEIARRL